jgi:hypothetical protein
VLTRFSHSSPPLPPWHHTPLLQVHAFPGTHPSFPGFPMLTHPLSEKSARYRRCVQRNHEGNNGEKGQVTASVSKGSGCVWLGFMTHRLYPPYQNFINSFLNRATAKPIFYLCSNQALINGHPLAEINACILRHCIKSRKNSGNDQGGRFGRFKCHCPTKMSNLSKSK